jgi:carbon monoxide dehydrogenase subunit G
VKVSESGSCSAPLHAVWECVSDDERRLRTHAGQIRERRLVGEGESVVALVVGSHREEMRLRVVEALPPSDGAAARLVERRVDGGREGQTVFELRPGGDGGTQVTITAEAQLPMLLSALVSGPLRAALKEQVANICRESGGDGC